MLLDIGIRKAEKKCHVVLIVLPHAWHSNAETLIAQSTSTLVIVIGIGTMTDI